MGSAVMFMSTLTLPLPLQACEVFDIPLTSVKLYMDRQRKKELESSPRKTIKGAKLSHGDMIFLYQATASTSSPMDVDDYSAPLTGTTSKHHSEPSTSTGVASNNSNNSTNSSSNSINSISTSSKVTVAEDKVDQLLHNEDGRIPGKRNAMLCRHKGNSRCIHCTDIDPWDEGYLKENNIKHMSFHTYIRKLKSGVDKGKFVHVSNMQCSIKKGCTDHPPWPQGICSSCQPSAVTLTRQPFRHVDNVVFENRAIVENFLTYWRTTG